MEQDETTTSNVDTLMALLLSRYVVKIIPDRNGATFHYNELVS